MTKFVLLTTQRTGSSFISSLLNNHNQISMFREILIPQSPTKGGIRIFALKNPKYRLIYKIFLIKYVRRSHFHVPYFFPVNKITKDFLDFFFNMDKDMLNELNDLNDEESKLNEYPLALGFKLMASQFNYFPYLNKWIKNEKPKIILLRRKNILAKYVSVLSKSIRGFAHSKNEVEEIKIKIDKKDFLKYYLKMKKENDFLLRFKKSNEVIDIYYETFFENIHQELNKLLNFLNVPEMRDIKFPALKKLNKSPLDNIISNYDEIINYCNQHKIEFILNE